MESAKRRAWGSGSPSITISISLGSSPSNRSRTAPPTSQAGRPASARKSLTAAIAGYEESLLPGATPPLAAADLQTRLKQLADRAGLKIRSEKILAHVAREAYLEIPVQIVATGDIRNIKDFLVALEASPVFIGVKDVSLGAAKRQARIMEARPATDAHDLQASMTLVGLLRADRG